MDTQTYESIAASLTSKLIVTTEAMEKYRKDLNDIRAIHADAEGLEAEMAQCEAERKKVIELSHRLLPEFLYSKVRDDVLAHHNRLGYCSCPKTIYVFKRTQ